MGTIQTRICNSLIPVVEIVQNRVRSDGGDAISVSDGKVSVCIIKSGMSECKAIVKTSIIPQTVVLDSDEWYPCLEMGTNFNWHRGISVSPTDIFIRRDTHLTLAYDHPDDPCHWTFTNIFGRRLALENNILYSLTSPATDGGPIPQADDEEWFEGEDGFDGQWSQCSFIPGEHLQLQWISKYGNTVKAAVVAGLWFATPAFTGGEVLSITGEGFEKRLSVKSQGLTFTVLPSDFAEYAVGDWIYLLKQGNNSATETDRDSEYGASDAEITASETLRAVPAKFNAYGANGDFETIDYTLDDSLNFPDSFEVSQHIGVITELWPDNVTPLRDAAKITIEGLYPRQTWWETLDEYVDIFYHCEGSETVEDGMAAFEVGDEVLVLNESGNPNPTADDLVIVGFKDELRSCDKQFIVEFKLIVSSTVTKYVYKLVGGSVSEFPLRHPDGSGLITQPFSTVSNYFEGYTLYEIKTYNNLVSMDDDSNNTTPSSTSENIDDSVDNTVYVCGPEVRNERSCTCADGVTVVTHYNYRHIGSLDGDFSWNSFHSNLTTTFADGSERVDLVRTNLNKEDGHWEDYCNGWGFSGGGCCDPGVVLTPVGGPCAWEEETINDSDFYIFEQSQPPDEENQNNSCLYSAYRRSRRSTQIRNLTSPFNSDVETVVTDDTYTSETNTIIKTNGSEEELTFYPHRRDFSFGFYHDKGTALFTETCFFSAGNVNQDDPDLNIFSDIDIYRQTGRPIIDAENEYYGYNLGSLSKVVSSATVYGWFGVTQEDLLDIYNDFTNDVINPLSISGVYEI